MEFSSAANIEMSSADWWFTGLDQRPFTVDNIRRTMQVLGVHVAGSHTWIQIEFAEDPDSSVLLHLTPWAGLQDAINMVLDAITGRMTGTAADSSFGVGEWCNLTLPSPTASARRLARSAG